MTEAALAPSPAPDFVVVGAVKSGTTSLFHYLREHPGIFLPASKELTYFCRQDAPGRITGRDEYLSFFRHAGPDQTVGEIATGYLYCPSAASLIAAELGAQTRIVIMLRNPVDLMYSLWGQNRRDGGEQLSFEAALAAEQARMADPRRRAELTGWPCNYAYRARALYAPQVARYLEVFGRQHVAVHVFEEFFASPAAAMSRLFRFLHVADRADRIRYQVHNRQAEVRWPWLRRLYFEDSPMARVVRKVTSPSLRRSMMMALYRLNTKQAPRASLAPERKRELLSWFEADIADLEEMLGRKLRGTWAGVGGH